MYIHVRPTYHMMTAPMVRLRPFAGSFLLAVVIFSTALCQSAAQGLSNSGMSPKNNMSAIPVVCKSKDIRNNISSFQALENCTVVEGFVQILLLDNVTEAEFKNVSFPRLTEITDYLMLYRVGALRSVGQLFPNLAVIRGQTKLFEYSLIIYEMKELQDIGLYSLREISSGHVRIDKNPSLCFVATIDWSSIVLDRQGDNFLQNLKSAEECPLCPTVADAARSSSEGGPVITPCQRGHCWNLEHCQLECPIACGNRSCDSKGNCCEENCIGCQDNEPHKCLVCRNVSAVLGNGCMDKCPDNSYMYLNRRCVTKKECVDMPNPLQFTNLNAKSKPQEKYHKVLAMKDEDGNTVRSCVLDCPTNYMEDKHKECIQCQAGRCEKECPGTVIDSISSAQQLRGCTHINGSLEIQIRGGKNVVSKLDECLSMIEEIDGYLKIVRSFPLISLNFLKKLRRIHGNILENKKFVIFVLDNQNLQELWDWTNRTLQIDKGKLFFHFNPRLCLDKIRTLQQKTHLSNYDELDVASSSNGDKIACHITDLNVTADIIESKYIILNWEQFQMKDHRKLLYYTVYSIEAPHQNITMFDGRDACGGEGWRVEDAPAVDGTVTYLLAQLKPYTQYAVYVQTYTIASEDSGAQSAIKYFRTAPGKPSKPQTIKIDATNNSLHISWKPPASPNGRISYYNVTITVDRSAEETSVNFCSAKPPTRIPMTTTIAPRVSSLDNNTCVCPAVPADRGKTIDYLNATSAENQIDFEDKLYDYVYVKRGPAAQHIRRTRSIMVDSSSINHVVNASDYQLVPELTEIFDERNRRLKYEQNVTDTDVRIENLVHFKQYLIYIQACRERQVASPGDNSNDTEDTCSEEAFEEKRTLMLEGVDEIQSLVVTNITSDSAVITWEDPVDPNGNIEGYHIMYSLVDDNDSTKSQNDCVSKNKTTTSHTLNRLRPGNWSVQILVTTQAGTAHTTRVFYFYVEQPVNVVAYVLGILGIIVGSLLLALYHFRYKCIRKDDRTMIKTVNPDYIPTDSPYVPDDWEVPRENIKLLSELGQGSFGMVYEGIASDINGKSEVRCAVKTVNEHATNRERIEFLIEASVMKEFDTTHVVRLLGVVSQGQPTLVIMELMANGDLKKYLRSHRPDAEAEARDGIERRPPDLGQILKMAVEIADGMAYLSAKKYLHRDVAARNCMVSENLVVKIGDFGMTRDIYETDYYRKGSKGLLPVRWMAPESLKDGLFSSASDVWSYGVVLWEMATLASQPYQGFSNEQVLRYVIGGNIMERPEKCPDILYDLMKRCWHYKPVDRPTFTRLCEFLLKYARSDFETVSFFYSPAGIEARSQRRNDSYDLDDVTTPLRVNEHTDDEVDHDPIGRSVLTPVVNTTGLDFSTYPSMTSNGYVTHRPTNGTNA